ncbi:MAG: class I SAM-dependent methyltransferase [Elusimicrobiaceae bacterium]|nr:class I SAM-dependent methyltransferase [Elusimicrobiaceae bacterium]
MPSKMLEFAQSLGLPLTPAQGEQLLAFAQCVWQKKEQLNLTGASSLEEIILRHICDGLVAAAEVKNRGLWQAHLADAGAGCGYIGLTLAVALPGAQVTLLESLEKRCKFMYWAVLQIGLKNATVRQVHLGAQTPFAFDLVSERAMGTLPAIAHTCLSAVKAGGIFMAFQGEHPQTDQVVCTQGTFEKDIAYQLPCDNKTRHLVLFKKNYA